MPPFQQQVPSQGGGSPQGRNDEAEKIHLRQQREQLQNRVRIKRGELVDRERRLHEIERETKDVENTLHHMEQDHRRFSEEHRRMEQEVKQSTSVEKHEELELRDATHELRRREDLTRKLEHDIAELKQQIAGKEHEIAEVKEEARGLMRVKEDHRRTGELEHFSVKSDGEHLHEREVKLTLLNQDIVRRQNELAHLKMQYQELHRDINTKEQDLMQMESQLQQLPH